MKGGNAHTIDGHKKAFASFGGTVAIDYAR